MRYSTYMLIAFSGLLLFNASCSKTVDTPNPLPGTKDSAFVLSEMIYSGLYNPGNNDFKNEFVYDTLGRVTTINSMSLNNGTYSAAEVITYYYNGSDTLPFKKTRRDITITNPFLESYFYYYDSQQRLIKDSANYDFEIDVNNYTYSNGKVISEGYAVSPDFPTDFYYINDTAFLNSAGEVSVVNTFRDPDHYSWKYTYDTHPNPLNLLNIRFAYPPFPVHDFLLEDFTASKNNVISVDDNNPPGYNQLVQTWTYDTSGYPTSADIVHDGGSVDDTRVLFHYKKTYKGL